jgi:DnaJ-class molecular chaperone
MMDFQENTFHVGDNMQDEKTFHMATCPDCGGTGGSYDDEGNWYKCYRCNGTGQVD